MKKQFKYKNTKIEIARPPAHSAKKIKCPDREEGLRNLCSAALKKAGEKKLKKITFGPYEFSIDTLSPAACAKIIAQEAYKHIKLTDTSLKRITIRLSEEKNIKLFERIVFGYLGYIINKLSNGPFSTADIIIEVGKGIVLIERSNPPFGWAIPGGFVDYGEAIETTARREAKEETSLDIFDLKQFHTYSAPGRDPRFQTITTVFTAKAKGSLKADSDARDIGIFTLSQIRKMKLAFDHNKVIEDFFKAKAKSRKASICRMR